MGYYDRESIEHAAYYSCLWEATARKVGNVHPNARFADVSYFDFLVSAGAIAPALGGAPQISLGQTVHSAVAYTRLATPSNSNLGIILLLAPLASCCWPTGTMNEGVDIGRRELRRNLRKSTRQDAKNVYEAIRLAAPGGLGDAPEQDVRDEPTVTLLEAMKLAADRDMVARQYANGFADVFDFGVPAFLAGYERFGCVEAAVIDCQLRWLAEYPDSLIARKKGQAVAEDVRQRAAAVLALGGLTTAEGRAAGVALDKHLRSDGNKLNPGTTADLVTACLFVALRENKVQPSAPFRWDEPDWL